jgi:superfamily II DNA or RNA helicase
MAVVFQLVGILKPAKRFDFSVYPFVCIVNDTEYLSVSEKLTASGIINLEEKHKAIALNLIELSASIESDALVARFAKKGVNSEDFWKKTDKKVFDQIILPFVEKVLISIVDQLRLHDIPLYESKYFPNLYPNERIQIYNSKAEANLRFRRSESGTIYTFEAFLNKQKVNLQHPNNCILTYEPCLYLSENRLFKFDNSINGKFLIPFLKKESIEIPKRIEAQYFSTFIKKIINRCEIIAEGFVINEIQAEPGADLVLEHDWQGLPSLVLMFTYGNKKVLANHPQKTITELKHGDLGFLFNKLKRDERWEEKQRKFLKSLGLIQFESTFRLPSDDKTNPTSALVDWIILHRDQIVDHGFRIEQKENDQYCFEPGSIELSLEAGADWFDLHAIVNIGKYKIPFSRFINNILQNLNKYILPDGSIFLLPNEWFTRYYDLAFFSKVKNGNLHLQKYQYRLLQGFDFPDIEALIHQESDAEVFDLPELFNVNLRPYQLFGFGWMKRLSKLGFGCLLADDMGLGKTLQVIAVLSLYYSFNKNKAEFNEIALSAESVPNGTQLDIFTHTDPIQLNFHTKDNLITEMQLPCSLVIMPASLIHNWMHELNRFAPFMKVYAHTGSGRSLSLETLKRNHIVITTYGTLRNDIDFLEKYSFSYVILDESQNIKNPFSKTANAIIRLQSDHRIALTGTPVENSLSDLWSQMNFLNPGLLGSYTTFNSYFSTQLAANLKHEVGDELLKLLQPFVLRRSKEDVAPELPPITEMISYCTMDEGQLKMYETEKSKVRNQIMEGVQDGVKSSSVMVLQALMQLRQIANHPRLIDPDSQSGSGKFDEITEKLLIILSENHKVLVFSSFVRHLKLFESWCKENRIRYAMLTGSTTDRENVVQSFKNDSEINIFLISLKAGGVGLNLAEADYVFILDPWWNPAAEMQAISRSHRIGQNRSVFVYRFITKGTVEEKIVRLQEKKKTLAKKFILSDSAIAGMSSEEVMEFFI